MKIKISPSLRIQPTPPTIATSHSTVQCTFAIGSHFPFHVDVGGGGGEELYNEHKGGNLFLFQKIV